MTTPAPTHKAGRDWTLLFVCWLIAVISMLGSLFFSEVMGVTPCVLCWYQRIAMYPLVFILPLGLFPLDVGVVRYLLPLPILGWLIALYQVALTMGYIPKSIQPCSKGVSCSENVIEWFGFLSIPVMSLFSFTVIIGLLLLVSKKVSK
ncbi:MAG: disulfide bond formation protein B [Magnetococcales bacterium]|nr:disulfide bond formation protein B [Magnetococcales bacterium]